MGRSTTSDSHLHAGATLTRNELFRYIFWEWIEPIGSALCIALIVMEYIVALYVIPTGSMQPTLQGGGDYGIGDKVLVNKFVYDYDAPKRWDVFVFDYPYKNVVCAHCEQTLIPTFDPNAPEVVPEGLACPYGSCSNLEPEFDFVEKEYIKRCVGLPGDEISIRDGNIVLWDDSSSTWTLPPKTRGAQDALWVKAWDSEKKHHRGEIAAFWKGAKASLQGLQNEDIVLPSRPEALIFHHDVARSGHGDKARPSPVPPVAPPTGDFAFDLEADRWPSEGTLRLDISRNIISHLAEVNFANKTIKLSVGGQTVTTLNTPAGLEHLRFARVDGTLQVLMDGEVFSTPIPNFDPQQLTKTTFPKITYQGKGELRLNRLQLLRDIHYVNMSNPYLSGPRRSAKLNVGEFFAMGDNSFHSFDSRDWGPVPEEKLIGKALMVLFPLGRTKFIE
jgi:signal peptidase I